MTNIRLYDFLWKTDKLFSLNGIHDLKIISVSYTHLATHFAHEEAYMESIHDPELDLQKKEHAAFTKKVNEFCLDTSSKEAAKASFNECISFLVHWLYHQDVYKRQFL